MFLTATLPPHIEAEFIRIIKVRPEDVYIFRALTTRPNIVYSVFKYNPDMDKTDTIY